MIAIYLSKFIDTGKDNKRRLDWNGINIFLQTKEFFELNISSKKDILFSLKGFDYINADGLIWLLLFGSELKKKNNSLWLLLPDDIVQLNFIKSSNFYKIAMEQFSIANIFDLESINDLDSPSRGMVFYKVNLESLTSINKDLDHFFTYDIFKKLHISKFGKVAYEYFPVFMQLINETSKNIVQHSQEEQYTGCGYLIINKIGRDIFRICVCDTGQGLLASLKSKKINVGDDFEAIKHALLYRYYKREGEGLFRVIQFISTMEGSIILRSGSEEAYLNLRNTKFCDDEETKSFIQNNLRINKRKIFFPGLQILIELKRQLYGL